MATQQTPTGQQAPPPQPPKTSDAPSPWTVISEYAKTAVTLGSALLAVTVTFSGTILGKFNSTIQLCLLILAWLSLVALIACAFKSLGYLINYLREGKKEDGNNSIFYANAAYGALVVAGIFLILVGGYYGVQSLYSPIVQDSTAAIEKTVSAMLTHICPLKAVRTIWSPHRLSRDSGMTGSFGCAKNQVRRPKYP